MVFVQGITAAPSWAWVIAPLALVILFSRGMHCQRQAIFYEKAKLDKIKKSFSNRAYGFFLLSTVLIGFLLGFYGQINIMWASIVKSGITEGVFPLTAIAAAGFLITKASRDASRSIDTLILPVSGILFALGVGAAAAMLWPPTIEMEGPTTQSDVAQTQLQYKTAQIDHLWTTITNLIDKQNKKMSSFNQLGTLQYILISIFGAILYSVSMSESRAYKAFEIRKKRYEKAAGIAFVLISISLVFAIIISVLNWRIWDLIGLPITLVISIIWWTRQKQAHGGEISYSGLAEGVRETLVRFAVANMPVGKAKHISDLYTFNATQDQVSKALVSLRMTDLVSRFGGNLNKTLSTLIPTKDQFSEELRSYALRGEIAVFNDQMHELSAEKVADWPDKDILVSRKTPTNADDIALKDSHGTGSKLLRRLIIWRK